MLAAITVSGERRGEHPHQVLSLNKMGIQLMPQYYTNSIQTVSPEPKIKLHQDIQITQGGHCYSHQCPESIHSQKT